MDLRDERIVITGGTRGIGRAIAELASEQGARVLACGSRPSSVRRFSAETGIDALCCDVAEAEDVQALAHAVASRFGGLDVLINCAAIQREIDLVRGADLGDIEHELAVNLLGPIRVTQALLEPLLSGDRATVVNVTSVLALVPKKRAPIYCASKAGLASWTRALRDQLRPHGVRVMELVPPVVATDMAGERAADAIDPKVVAHACLQGIVRGRTCVAVGQARFGRALYRIAPGLLARMLRDG